MSTDGLVYYLPTEVRDNIGHSEHKSLGIHSKRQRKKYMIKGDQDYYGEIYSYSRNNLLETH